MNNTKIQEMAHISIMTVVIIICAWITVPFVIPFTMQTFGIFLSLKILGGRNGTVSILIYIMLGIIGLPVFSGFNSGIGCLMGPTGGYIAGFLICGLFYRIISPLREGTIFKNAVLLTGLLICYILGTLWFVYSGTETENTNFVTAFAVCVLPYISFDLIKLFLAEYTARRIRRYIRS